jgi:hypothetical protein
MSTDRIPATEAARKLGIKPHTLAVWRLRGVGPSYVRFGDVKRGRVYYSAETLDRFLAERTFTSTAAETVKDSARACAPGDALSAAG